MARLLRGKPLADTIAADIRERVGRLQQRGVTAALTVISASAHPTARLYAERLQRSGSRLGLGVRSVDVRDDAEVRHAIDDANRDRAVHGVILLTPLPAGVDAREATERVAPEKDVEGQHPYNTGRLTLGAPTYLPTTAEAVMLMLRASGVQLRGAHALVVGRSAVVGRPVALLLIAENATVTLAHSNTRNLGVLTREAEVLVVAAGRAGLVTGDMVRLGATVVDTGINPTPEGVVGDVDFASVSQVAEAITPVPGGVGSLTTVLLLRNTIHAAENRLEKP